MSTFTRKYGKFIPGTVILLLHVLFVVLTSTGDFSGPQIAAGKTWVQVIGLLLMLSTVIYGFKYPYDGPETRSSNVNVPVISGLIFLIVATVVGWILFYWGGVYSY